MTRSSPIGTAVVVAGTVLSLVVLAEGSPRAARANAGSLLAAATTCPVTLPNGRQPPTSGAATLPPLPPVFHEKGKLWVKLWPLGVIVARSNVIRRDGSIDIKLPWWRGVAGRLTITGARLDAPARPVTADVPSGYGRSGFQPSGVVFPSQGCWKVTGRVGKAQLEFVTLVVRAAGNGY